MHQPRDVLEADVAGLQLFVIEHAHAAPPRLGVAVEREVDFLDAVALGAGAELRLGARRAAAEQNEVVLVHDRFRNVRAVPPFVLPMPSLSRRRFRRGFAFVQRLRSADACGFVDLPCAVFARGAAAFGAGVGFAADVRRRRLGGSRVPAFSARGALDDRREHRAGLAAFGRPVRLPDVRVVCGEDVFEVAVALHAERRELGDVDVAGPVVAVLDQQPAPAVAAADRAPHRPPVRTSTHEPFSL